MEKYFALDIWCMFLCDTFECAPSKLHMLCRRKETFLSSCFCLFANKYTKSHTFILIKSNNQYWLITRWVIILTKGATDYVKNRNIEWIVRSKLSTTKKFYWCFSTRKLRFKNSRFVINKIEILCDHRKIN